RTRRLISNRNSFLILLPVGFAGNIKLLVGDDRIPRGKLLRFGHTFAFEIETLPGLIRYTWFAIFVPYGDARADQKLNNNMSMVSVFVWIQYRSFNTFCSIFIAYFQSTLIVPSLQFIANCYIQFSSRLCYILFPLYIF